MMQRTFGEVVGLDPVVPVGPHPNDLVECADGTICRRIDTVLDCKGNPHRNEEERHDADVTIVTDWLNEHDKWVVEYVTEHEDYPAGAAYIVNEVSHEWPDRVEEWIRDNHGDWLGHTKFDDSMDELVSAICEEIDDCEVEFEYTSGYACYSGSGCNLFSLTMDEHEDQVDIAAIPELAALHDERRLDDVLDDVSADCCIGRSRRREKNEETGYYEPVGRETYMPYDHHAEYPTFETYHCVTGHWAYAVPAERMAELLTEAIITVARKGGAA
ncbi:MAG: hypothetical protein ACYS7Y_35205 [Planctomycetota bacterium]|jgi:hypothetical protein